jgi:hypothetical protein
VWKQFEIFQTLDCNNAYTACISLMPKQIYDLATFMRRVKELRAPFKLKLTELHCYPTLVLSLEVNVP